jgi:hypothetical protein
MSVFLAGNIVLNIFLSAGLKFMWKMLDALQLMVHMPMIKVAYPANTLFFFSLVIDLLNFRVVPVDSLLSKMGLSTGSSSEETEEQESDAFAKRLLYDSTEEQEEGGMIANMGLFFLCISLFIIMLFVGFIAYYFLRKNEKAKKIFKWISALIFYNSILRTCITGYLGYSIPAMVNSANP